MSSSCILFIFMNGTTNGTVTVYGLYKLFEYRFCQKWAIFISFRQNVRLSLDIYVWHGWLVWFTVHRCTALYGIIIPLDNKHHISVVHGQDTNLQLAVISYLIYQLIQWSCHLLLVLLKVEVHIWIMSEREGLLEDSDQESVPQEVDHEVNLR